MWELYLEKFREPPPPNIGILDFTKFELSIKFREAPLPNMGILDLSKFELSINFREPPPPPHPQHGNFGF